MKITLKINNEKKDIEIKPNEVLADVLRKMGLYSVKIGCREGSCGACTVLVDGRAIYSCIKLAAQLTGHDITTIEGISDFDSPHPIQKALVDAGAVQCGYCIPGMVLSAKALLDENKKPTDEEIKKALDGNLCRCTGYVKQIEGIKKVVRGVR